MKTTLIALVVMLSLCASAQSKVSSYTKKNGTHVESYHRSTADHTERNNYSAKGNTNPYNGKKGYKTPKK